MMPFYLSCLICLDQVGVLHNHLYIIDFTYIHTYMHVTFFDVKVYLIIMVITVVYHMSAWFLDRSVHVYNLCVWCVCVYVCVCSMLIVQQIHLV